MHCGQSVLSVNINQTETLRLNAEATERLLTAQANASAQPFKKKLALRLTV